MQAGQDLVWYVTADSHAAAKGSPQIEALRAKGVEVLLLSDRIDEWMIGYLGEYAGKKLRNAAKGEPEAAEGEEAERRKQADEAAAPLVARLAEVLGDRVAKVQASHRLTESPSCIVLGEHDMALHMQRLLREAGHEVPDSAPTLEINPAHPLVQAFSAEPDAARAGDIALLLLEEARLAAGDQLEDPAAFIARVNRVVLGQSA
jgi:molecular chaperone HtpG